MDSREINKQTPKRSWPVPLIQDLLRRVAKSRWFSKFDLKSGFWQLSLDEESSAKLGFATSEGKYEWTRLCFGLKNALFEFQKAMYTLLGDLSFIEIYVDDLILHATTYWEHIENIKVVLNRLKDAGLKINGLKTVFCAKRIKLLGHVIENGIIAMDEDKIRAIVERKPPTDVKGVQSWVGSANYYRPFIQDFARMAKPLFVLMCDDVVFIWTTECQLAFDQIKQVFITAPILRIADLSRMFLLYTDSSEFAFGGILAQMDDIPMEYVVEYASKLFKGSQLSWHITMKELYAIVWCLKHFRVYLQNVRFKVITDHKALIYLDSQKDLSNKLARIKVFLSQFDMEIVHRKGKLHANVDMLSRPVLVIRGRENANPNDLIFHNPKITQDENNKGLDAWHDDNLLYFLKYNKYTPGLSRKQVSRITKEAQHFKFDSQKLWYRDDLKSMNFREYPSESDRVEIIEKAHLFGHFAAASTYNRIKSKYYWRRMMDDVIKVVGQCMVCLRNKKFKFQEHEAMALEYEGVGDTIHIDIISGLPETKEGYCKILTIVERITGNGMAEPLKTKTMTEVKGKLLLYFSIYGLPKKIISDAGREFVNEIIDGLLTSVGVDHKVTSSFNARTNGAGERFNQSLMEALRCHCEANPRNWPDGLIWVMWAYRTRINPITGYSPYMLTYGREMNGFEDWTTKPDQAEEITKRELMARAKQIEDLIVVKQQRATCKPLDQQEVQKAIQNSRANLRQEALTPGTRVMLKREGILSKLEARFSGPFLVTRRTANFNYELEDILGNKLKQSYPLHKLKIADHFDSNVLEDEVDEIVEVLDHKFDKDGNFYLVKWKNDNVNSWIPEENFNTMEIINKYFDKINNQKTKRKTWTRKKSAKINVISTILVILKLCILTMT